MCCEFGSCCFSKLLLARSVQEQHFTFAQQPLCCSRMISSTTCMSRYFAAWFSRVLAIFRAELEHSCSCFLQLPQPKLYFIRTESILSPHCQVACTGTVYCNIQWYYLTVNDLLILKHILFIAAAIGSAESIQNLSRQSALSRRHQYIVYCIHMAHAIPGWIL